MTATLHVNRLANMDVQVSAADGRLIVDGPEEILTDDFLATVRHYRLELLELVAPGHPTSAAALRELVSHWPEAKCDAFKERAGSVQHVAGLPREAPDAEALDQALDEEVVKILAAWAAERGGGVDNLHKTVGAPRYHLYAFARKRARLRRRNLTCARRRDRSD